ncbi:MAG: hypothetical protein ACC660_02300, partial [Acidimicrobiales bacterium]
MALLVAFAIMATAVAPASGQTRNDPPWRDADEAATQLAAGQVRLLNARDALVAAEQRLVDLREAQVGAKEETFVVAAQLQAVQDLATDLAVEAYMSGDALTDVSFALDAGGATDFAYRTTLLSESADVVVQTTAEYFALRSQASDDAVDLAEELGGMDAAIESAAEEITEAELALVDLEWVLFI